MSHPENQYIELINKILNEGELRKTRNGNTYSLFGERLVFDVNKHGFPLLTTKRVFLRGIIEELLWFLRGDTNAKYLSDNGVKIWDGNSTRAFLDSRGLDYPEGECGPIYGYQWRCFNGQYPERTGGIDQIRYVLNELINNPTGRRALFTGWNPQQLDAMALPPCHVLYEFYISNKGLSCMMVQRSADFILGVPFNIASTTLLTTIFAHIIGIPVDKIIICLGDTHIYEAHLEGAKEQINRVPYDFPSLKITKDAPIKDSSIDEKIKWIESLKYEDFLLTDYKYHPSIKFEMMA